MTKKQVATKSSGKGKNVEPSSSAVPIIDVPKAAKKKSLLAERGFSAENPSPEFISTVTALGWEKFVTHRKEYIATLVRDFYEGIQERNDGKPATTSLVRGEEIKFDARTINDYYGLGYYGKAIENKQKNYGLAEMNEVKARICIEDAVWEKSGELGSEFKILTRYLCDEANLWFRFIRHSLLPTSHTLYVDKERLLVIDAIMSRDKVEVGKLINREINKWQHRKDGNLYFPCLVTDLCMDIGCEIEAGELREEPSGPFATKFKPRPRPGNASTSVDSQTLQRLVDQQNSLARFVKEQFEWQKKIVAHVTKGKAGIQEPVLPDWMREGEEEETEDDIPLSAMQVKKEKAKRVRSPAKSKQGPAKKKQKKSSSEEELRSSDLDIISDPDAEESARVAEEVNSEEDEERTESEERGSSSDKTDIQVDSPPQPAQKAVGPSKTAKPKPSPQPEPPVQEPISPEIPQPTPPQVIIPQPPPSKPVSPQKEQPEPNTNPEPNQDPNQPMTQEEPQPEDQPQQQPMQEPQEQNVAASEAATEKPEAVKEPKQRVKHMMKQSPFGRQKRGASSTASEQQTEPVGAEEEVQQPKQSKPQKLQVKRKPRPDMGSPATATSGAFIATRSTSITVSTGTAAEHSDATASNAPEVEKAPINPAVTKETSDAELAKSKAWEEAKQRLAEQSSKAAQDASAASAGEAASEETTVAAEEEAEKKKEKKKKKGTQSSQLPPRQSGRLRSGALKK